MLRHTIVRLSGACLLAALALPAPATNYQDLWWNPNESGWGINISQQDNTMFATWFIYAANGQPTWVVMAGAPRSGASGTTFTGDLYQTTGTPFSVIPFVPSQPANVTRVGTASFVFGDDHSGTLTYSINGAQVVKQITRQFLAAINLSATYFGGLAKNASGCNNPALNGSSVNTSTFQVTHTPSIGSITIIEVGGNLCRFTGTAQQYGSILEASGNYNCAGDGSVGTWTGRDGTGTDTTFAFKLTMRPGGDVCTVTSTIGGFRSSQGTL